METFLRVDVDGYYGLVEGVPALIDLFQELGIRASFFFNMGREANLLEILRYRSADSEKVAKQ